MKGRTAPAYLPVLIGRVSLYGTLTSGKFPSGSTSPLSPAEPEDEIGNSIVDQIPRCAICITDQSGTGVETEICENERTKTWKGEAVSRDKVGLLWRGTCFCRGPVLPMPVWCP